MPAFHCLEIPLAGIPPKVVFGDASDLDRQGPAHCLLNFLLFLKEELLELFEIHLVLRFILVIVRKVVSLH